MLKREELVKTAERGDPAAEIRLVRSWAVGRIQPVGQGFFNAVYEEDSLKGLPIIQIREPTEISCP